MLQDFFLNLSSSLNSLPVITIWLIQIIFCYLSILLSLKFFGKTYLVDLNHKKTSFNVEIGGNVNKFVNFKSITIDNDWKKNMKFIDYILVTSLMWPMLIFFKYKITR